MSLLHLYSIVNFTAVIQIPFCLSIAYTFICKYLSSYILRLLPVSALFLDMVFSTDLIFFSVAEDSEFFLFCSSSIY